MFSSVSVRYISKGARYAIEEEKWVQIGRAGVMYVRGYWRCNLNIERASNLPSREATGRKWHSSILHSIHDLGTPREFWLVGIPHCIYAYGRRNSKTAGWSSGIVIWRMIEIANWSRSWCLFVLSSATIEVKRPSSRLLNAVRWLVWCLSPFCEVSSNYTS